MKYTVKVIGIKDSQVEKIKELLEFERSWLERNGNPHKILILHYLLTAFGGNKEEIEDYERKGWEVYTLEPDDIGGVTEVSLKGGNCQEYNYRVEI